MYNFKNIKIYLTVKVLILYITLSPTLYGINQAKHNRQLMSKLEILTAKIIDKGTYDSSTKNEFFIIYKDYRNKYRQGDILNTVFIVFRESIEKTNEDKINFLNKLKEINDLNKAISDYLAELNDQNIDLEGLDLERNDAGSNSTEGWGDSNGKKQTCMLNNYTKIVNQLTKKSRHKSGNIKRLKVKKFKSINRKPAKIMIHNKREAIIYRLQFKKNLANLNKAREWWKKQLRLLELRKKKLQRIIPIIKQRMSLDVKLFYNRLNKKE